MPDEFVSEPIQPDAGTFDAKGMSRGEPGLPTGFTWREKHYAIIETLANWKHVESWDHGGGDKYYRRHYYRVRTDSGEVMVIYGLRHIKPGQSAKKRWWLYMIESAAPTSSGERDAERDDLKRS